jgi:hypothetical protein
MKAYGGSGCIDPHFLDFGISWRWVVSFTHRPLYPLGKSHSIGGWMDPTAGLDNVIKENSWPYQDSNSNTSVQSLYWLRYPGSNFCLRKERNERSCTLFTFRITALTFPWHQHSTRVVSWITLPQLQPWTLWLDACALTRHFYAHTLKYSQNIMQYADPLLGNYCEISKYTRVIAE